MVGRGLGQVEWQHLISGFLQEDSSIATKLQLFSSIKEGIDKIRASYIVQCLPKKAFPSFSH